MNINDFFINLAWTSPYLDSIDPRVSITYNYVEPNNVITIFMEEEIPSPVPIAVFKDYYDAPSPTLTFLIGSNSNLGVSFSQNNTESQWQMNINQRQDYENTFMRFYSFYIYGINGIRLHVTVWVQNIFDNAPTVIQITNPCEVPVRNVKNFIN